jgi:hypothetical protein
LPDRSNWYYFSRSIKTKWPARASKLWNDAEWSYYFSLHECVVVESALFFLDLNKT